MNQKPNSRIFVIALVCLLAFGFLNVAVTSAASQKVDLHKVDKLLKKIKKYKFGDSREKLTELSAVLRSAGNSPEVLRPIEKRFDNFLNSKATFAGKQFICHKLSLIGSEASVPTLSKLLVDPKTSDMARYALERIPGAKVNEALLAALAQTSGKTRIGIINSLGVRKDAKAITTLEQFVNDSDAMTATAALAALGNIAQPAAASILDNAIETTSGQVRVTALASYLKVADNLAASGKTNEAIEIYQKLDGPDVPASIRVAAFRGQYKADGDKAGLYLLKVIKNGDPQVKKVAIQLVRELPQKDQLGQIAAELPNLCPKNKVQLITALADIGDHSVRDVVLKATTDENKNVRLAAIKALASLGEVVDVELLAKIAASADRDESGAAAESLSLLRGNDVDQTIITAIPSADPKVKVALINSLGARDATSAVDNLLKSTNDPDQKVSKASIKVLAELASPKYMPQLLNVLLNCKSDAERNDAIMTVTNVAHKITDEKNQAADVIAKLGQVQNKDARIALLRVLGKVGDEHALPILKKALQNDDQNVQIAAIRALSDWPTANPINDLLQIAKTSTNERNQVLALRGFIRMIKLENDRPEKESIALYKQAMGLAKNAGEKRMVLSGLGELRTVAALNAAMGYISNDDLRTEAEMASFKIVRRLRRDHPKDARKALLKIISTTKNESLKKDARKELKRIK
ncbi:MAG: hypothetical protein GWP06_02500 [Actinobacteria bacterium]|nr:hypothetical protein [Actinomycetota bacterium]